MTVTDIPRSALAQGELIASVIAQLAAAETFLASTPGVMVSSHAPTIVYYFAATPAEVDGIAAAIGETPGWNIEGTHYYVEREFGPEVSYKAVYIREDREDRPEGLAAA